MKFFSQIFGVPKAQQVPVLSNWILNDSFAKQFKVFGFGTISDLNVSYRRIMDTLEVRLLCTVGTLQAAQALIRLPSSVLIDNRKIHVPGTGNEAITGNQVGMMYAITSTSNALNLDTIQAVIAVGPLSDNSVNICRIANSNSFFTANGSDFSADMTILTATFSVPIREWNVTSQV